MHLSKTQFYREVNEIILKSLDILEEEYSIHDPSIVLSHYEVRYTSNSYQPSYSVAIYHLQGELKDKIYSEWVEMPRENLGEDLTYGKTPFYERMGTFYSIMFSILDEVIRFEAETFSKWFSFQDPKHESSARLMDNDTDFIKEICNRTWEICARKKFRYESVCYIKGLKFDSIKIPETMRFSYQGKPITVHVTPHSSKDRIGRIGRFPSHQQFTQVFGDYPRNPLEFLHVEFQSDEFIPNLEIFSINGIETSFALLFGKKVKAGVVTRVEGLFEENFCSIIGGSKSGGYRKFDSPTFLSISFFYDHITGFHQERGISARNTSIGMPSRTMHIPVVFKEIDPRKMEFILKCTEYFHDFSPKTCDFNEEVDQIPIAFRRFFKFLPTQWLEDKLLDASILIELLFSTKSHEIQFEIALKLAAILGRNLNEKKIIIHVFKIIYGLRSALVHSGKSPSTVEDFKYFKNRRINFHDFLFDLIRLSLLYFISTDQMFQMKEIEEIQEISNDLILNEPNHHKPSEVFKTLQEDFWVNYEIILYKPSNKWIKKLKQHIQEIKDRIGSNWIEKKFPFDKLDSILKAESVFELRQLENQIYDFDLEKITQILQNHNILQEMVQKFEKIIQYPPKNETLHFTVF
ncbi:hypothetical protein [Candidatus Lokiarchaeum ossiferum]|uniref:hypothetical protein n=1 Tax=Candidatus Lokiarchaeum ossiferum TaxID=2951803 RepID=UPI00352EFEA0